jgi:hypothetical protein
MKKTLTFLFVLGLALALRVSGTNAQTATDPALAISLSNAVISPGNTASIGWTTNAWESCGVVYGTNANFNSSNSNGVLSQTEATTSIGNYYYTAKLTGLTPAANYYYRVNCTTADGQSVSSNLGYLSQNSQPSGSATIIISNLGVPTASITSNSLTVTWLTNINTDSIVYYKASSDTSWSWQGTDGLTNNHSVVLPNLQPSTTYNIYVNAKDANGNVVKSSDSWGETLAISASVALSITKTGVGMNSAAGSGTVTDARGAINCGNTCSAQFANGTTVTLTATPAADSVFGSWTGCGVTSTENKNQVCTIQLEGDTHLNASFFSQAYAQATAAAPSVTQINNNASQLYNGGMDSLLAQINQLRNTIAEQASQIKYLASLIKGVPQIPQATLDAINNFITYGVDQNTVKLGAGQRAAVVNSFKSAFDRLPTTQTDITDVVKIANGRWPGQTSPTAIADAKVDFKKVYLRDADMNNANDNAAITIMAYGLQQQAQNRNLNSERAGIKTFKYVYGRLPSSAQDWNVVMAITYSGATR